MDLEQYEHTAAWLEYCDGMSRFAAETEAARRQGYKRHEVQHEISKRNSEGRRDNGQAAIRQPAGNLPGVQSHAAQEVRSMLIGLILAGWGGVVLPSLWAFGGGMV